MRALVVLLTAAACAAPGDADREQRIVTSLADTLYPWALRDRELVGLQLTKMQRGPYEWLRGTAPLYWRDLLDPGAERATTSFGDPASSRVLLVGDPHPENLGTFRAADGTMVVDWNDFDATGYGPFTADLQRMCAALVIAVADPSIAEELVRRAIDGYSAQIAVLATGARIAPVGVGVDPLLDKELTKARTRGDVRFALDEVAPIANGARAIAFGDLEAVAADGVMEDRVISVDAETSATIDRAVEIWRVGHPDAGAIKLRARRIGAGVASYAALRLQVVLEGPSAALEDDRLIELKETREGVILRGVPQLAAAEWSSPAARAVDTQQRLHARPDADVLLGHALVGGLSLKIRNREAYQRGLDHLDLADLAAGSAAKRMQLLALGELFGGLLARAHGQTRTADFVPGWTVIAPLLAGREAAFSDEITVRALADADRVTADHLLMMNTDLLGLIAPESP